MDAAQFVLTLMDTSGIGDRTLASILRRNAVLRREPAQMLSLPADALAREYDLKDTLADALLRCASKAGEKNALLSKRLSESGVSILSIVDASYPHRLTERLARPPAVL